MRVALWSVWLLGLALAPSASGQELPFVNWENHPVHALDLNPERTILAVAHTADARVQLFDVTGLEPLAIGHVAVGIDPVGVRFRNNSELWVVNHVSDSVSVIDVATRTVRATLQTADEPFDVVFAGGRAFVSCSQANQIQVFDVSDLTRAPISVPILAEDPRSLAVSADGREVYAAIFESGNATTILAGGLVDPQAGLPNVVSDSRGPYAGVNPPPNRGSTFSPALNPVARPPAVGLIVRRGADQRWRDDNQGDWTRFVSGDLAQASGRRVGWDLADRDIAVIDSSALSVRYVTGLMNIGMALAVNPASRELTLVGTDAHNEIRFEPNVNGRFVRVNLARVNPSAGGAKTLSDLNPQLNYATATLPQSQRDQAIGDPRAIVWRADGERAWIAGLGSNNVVQINAQGARVGAPIRVGQGPVGLSLDEPRARLYVWNHFDVSLSVIDTQAARELQRIAVFNPLPAAIRAGRPMLYDTQRTSGLGQASCASCHIDARMDRLAWDLGNPAEPPARFDQNCLRSVLQAPCEDFHSMKGPMTTQTMQDIIGHEPFHWRGDHAGIEAFNPAFEKLLGDDQLLTTAEMQQFENFLASVTFPPNPFRNFDNSLPNNLALTGQRTSGRFAMAGLPLVNGNAERGLNLYTRGLLDAPFQCSSCHSLPTGMAANGPLLLGNVPFPVGGVVMPHGPLGENRLGLVSTDGSTNVSMKVPQLRNQYEKIGFESTQTDNVAGFGFLHDGSVDSLAQFLSARVFSVASDQQVADLVAFSMAFSGSDFGANLPITSVPTPQSKDSHAAVGKQLTISNATQPARLAEMIGLAQARRVDLIARQRASGFVFDVTLNAFKPDDGGAVIQLSALAQRATVAAPITFSVVPLGLGARLGTDRDGDGVNNAREIAQGSNPADAASKALRPRAGLWANPNRGGSGFDVQHVGNNLSVIWYTYRDDGTPAWYTAYGTLGALFTSELYSYRWDATLGRAVGSIVGELKFSAQDARRGTFQWRLGTRSGSEPVQIFLDGLQPPNPDRTGTWYSSAEPGWGMSIVSDGNTRGVVTYFFDGLGAPRWVTGFASATDLDPQPMLSLRGACPDCPAVAPSNSSGGSVSFNFTQTRRAQVIVNVFDAGQPQAVWVRNTTFAPLSDPMLRPEAQ